MNIIKYAKNKSKILNAVIMTLDKDVFDILRKYMKPIKTSKTTIHLDKDIIYDILYHKKVNYFIYNDNNYKVDIVLYTKLILI